MIGDAHTDARQCIAEAASYRWGAFQEVVASIRFLTVAAP